MQVLRREVEGMALNVCHQLQDAGVKAAVFGDLWKGLKETGKG